MPEIETMPDEKALIHVMRAIETHEMLLKAAKLTADHAEKLETATPRVDGAGELCIKACEALRLAGEQDMADRPTPWDSYIRVPYSDMPEEEALEYARMALESFDDLVEVAKATLEFYGERNDGGYQYDVADKALYAAGYARWQSDRLVLNHDMHMKHMKSLYPDAAEIYEKYGEIE